MVAWGGMRGCSGGVHGCSGHVWLLGGGMHGCSRGGVRGCSGGCAWDMTRYGDTVHERSVCILLECILVFLKFSPFSPERTQTLSSGDTESEVRIGNLNVKA